MVRRRLETDKENLRQEILDAARDMFVEHGFENVSMRKIAERIGFSATTIYLYFRDKNDLLNQICTQTFMRLERNISAIYLLSDNPLEKLRSGMREYIHFGLKNPTQYTLVFITPLAHDYVPDDTNTGDAAFDTLRQVVRECADAGALRSDDVETVSQSIWASLHGVTSLLIKHPGFPFVERDRLIDSVIDICLAGIRK